MKPNAVLTSSLTPSQTPCNGSPSGQLPTVFIVHPDITWCYRMSLWTIWVSCPLTAFHAPPASFLAEFRRDLGIA